LVPKLAREKVSPRLQCAIIQASGKARTCFIGYLDGIGSRGLKKGYLKKIVAACNECIDISELDLYHDKKQA
jgi:hypothetical protein